MNDHKSSVESFCKEYLAVPTSDLISIDEAGFYIGDTCRRGYCQRGKRLNIQISRTLRMSKLTLIAAVSVKGIVHYKILDHNCKKVDFVQFVSELHGQIPKIKGVPQSNVPSCMHRAPPFRLVRAS